MQQPSSGEMAGVTSSSSSLPQNPTQQNHDDFLDQMFSSGVPSWTDFSKSPWELTDPTAPTDDTILLATRLHQNQISSDGGGGATPGTGCLKSPPGEMHNLMMSLLTTDESGMMPLPLSVSNAFNPSVGSDGLYTGFGVSLPQQQQQPQQQPISHPQGGGQSYGGGLQQQQPPGIAQAAHSQPVGGVTAPPRHRVRARRGQATDPHSIAERLRRERIAERMKALQELVPNGNKTDKASMLDEIIEYVKFLQLQVKVLSMSRLGGAAAVAPLVAAGMYSSDGGGSIGGGGGVAAVGSTSSNDDGSLAMTEQQVAKLMEEDMGTAMQYLQGKGLCLMPISLASAISTATGHHRKITTAVAAAASPAAVANSRRHQPDGQSSSSSSMSVLTTTIQSADKNNVSISKP